MSEEAIDKAYAAWAGPCGETNEAKSAYQVGRMAWWAAMRSCAAGPWVTIEAGAERPEQRQPLLLKLPKGKVIFGYYFDGDFIDQTGALRHPTHYAMLRRMLEAK